MNKASLKIIILSPNFPKMSWPCGVADFVSNLAINLSKDNNITILTTNPNAQPLTQHPSITLKVIPGKWNLRHAIKIWSWLRKENFDVIDLQYEAAMFNHSVTPFLLILGLLFKKGKKIITLHSVALPRFLKHFWRIIQMTCFDCVVFYSQPFLVKMKKLFPWAAFKFELIGFPSNILRYQNEDTSTFIGKIKTGLLKSSLIGVYFGHINSNRGIEDILQTFLELKPKHFNTQFIFLGQFLPQQNDYHRQLLEWVQSRGLSNQISFSGELDSQQVSLLLQAADYSILPFPDGVSFKNGSFAAIIEHEVPVITTATNITENEILDCKGIKTWKPGQNTELLNILDQILSHPAELSTMRTQVAKLRDLISWAAYTNTRVKIHQRLMS